MHPTNVCEMFVLHEWMSNCEYFNPSVYSASLLESSGEKPETINGMILFSFYL